MTTAPNGVIWIASYPKSGNTWLRFLLCNLVFGPVESAAGLNERIPDLHEMQAVPGFGPGLTFVKTHFPYTPALPLVERTAAAIYIIRDPGDVMLSNFHYARRSGVAADDGAGQLERYVDSFLGTGGDPRWVKLGMGSWAENVVSWHTARSRIPVIWLRYEDLLADTVGIARTLCGHLRLTRGAAELEAAVAAASFERMRAIEEADISARRPGIFYKPYLQSSIDVGLRFMRSGRSGEAAQRLSPSQRSRFDAVFGPLRQQFGYASIS
jgi:hypothetical protein